MIANPKPWPDRYVVTLSSLDGETVEYAVTSWQSEAKAIALAVAQHTQEGRKPIYQVSVKCLGPAARDPSGVVALSGDLIDRMEW